MILNLFKKLHLNYRYIMVSKNIEALFETKRAVLLYFNFVLISETDHIVVISDLYSEFSVSYLSQPVTKKKFTLLLKEFLERNSIHFQQSFLKRTSTALILTNVRQAKYNFPKNVMV